MAKKQNGILDDMMKLIDNPYASIAENGTIADISGYVDTGSYALNALFSGDIYLGMPQNHVSCFAGEQTTGKTFFCLDVAKNFLQLNENSVVLIFDTESAIKTKNLRERGMPTNRVLIIPVETIQQFKTQALKIIRKHIDNEDPKKPKMMIILDSLGMLSTSKEQADSLEGKETKDMTKAQEIKAAFRTLTLPASKADIPILVTNHVYAVIGSYVPTKDMGGGGGLKFAANNIVFLSKKKEKENDEVIGNVIHCKGIKLRDTRENREVDVLLRYDSGLDRYYGLQDIAIKHGIFKKVDKKIQLPDGTTEFESRINKNPTKYYTKEVLDAINAACKVEFLYGSAQPDPEDDTLLEADE
jgi:RecA/RadA recombinase